MRNSCKKRNLSTKNMQALKRVWQTLQLLSDFYPPTILFEEWMALAQKAEIVYTLREQEKIKKYLDYHAREIKHLLLLFDELTK